MEGIKVMRFTYQSCPLPDPDPDPDDLHPDPDDQAMLLVTLLLVTYHDAVDEHGVCRQVPLVLL